MLLKSNHLLPTKGKRRRSGTGSLVTSRAWNIHKERYEGWKKVTLPQSECGWCTPGPDASRWRDSWAEKGKETSADVVEECSDFKMGVMPCERLIQSKDCDGVQKKEEAIAKHLCALKFSATFKCMVCHFDRSLYKNTACIWILNTVSLEPAGSGGVRLVQSVGSSGGIKPWITSDSSLVRSRLLTRREVQRWLFKLLGLKRRFIFTPVYQSDCSSNPRRWRPFSNVCQL